MSKRPKLGWREVALMLVPTLALICWGVLLQNRRPFKLIIEKLIISTPAKVGFGPIDPGYRGVKVVVFIGHEGAAPSWWGVGVNSEISRVRFTRKGEKDKPENVGGYSGLDFDNSTNLYRFVYQGQIPSDAGFLPGATCHVKAQLETQTVPHKNLAIVRESLPAKDFVEAN